jgi:hypothetical protein
MADPAVRTAALLFFYGYVATLVAAGVFGFLFARLDLHWFIGVDFNAFDDRTAANLGSQYRFLRAIEAGFGVFVLLHRRQIFSQAFYARLFLLAMGAGIAARIVGLVADGSPSRAMYFFLAYELVGIALIGAATRAAFRPA